MRVKPLDRVVIPWGASSAIDRVISHQPISSDHKGMQACALRTLRGHLVFQSYGTPVLVVFNYYLERANKASAYLWGWSQSTSKQLSIFRREHLSYFDICETPRWYYDSRKSIYWAETYVGDRDPFDPYTWAAADTEIVRVGYDEFAAGTMVRKAGDTKILRYMNYTGKLRYQVYNEDLMRLKKYKYQWRQEGFDSEREAIESLPEAFLKELTLQRLNNVA